MSKRNEKELYKTIANTIGSDPIVINETSAAAKALERGYNQRIKMAETRLKLAEKDIKDMKQIFKKVSDQLKIYNKTLQRDEKSFDSIGDIFEQLGYATYATQCREKAAYIRDLLARHRAFLTHMKTLIDTIMPGGRK